MFFVPRALDHSWGTPIVIEPVILTEAKKSMLKPEDRLKLANTLRNCAHYIETDQLKSGHPCAVMVVILTDDVPDVVSSGLTSWDDFGIVSRSLISYEQGMREKSRGKDVDLHAVVAERHRLALRLEQRRKDERAAYEAVHPWSCEFCRVRYKTEYWAKKHETRCYKNPNADQYGATGLYIPLQVKNGIAYGFTMKTGYEEPKTQEDGLL